MYKKNYKDNKKR